jgi:vitamin B12 transporter
VSNFGTTPFEGNKQTVELFGHYDLGKYVQALAGFRFDKFLMKDPSPSIADTSTNLASPFVSLFLKDLGGFNLDLGARYNNHSQYGDNFTYSINPSYLINRVLKIFANYGTAFKAPAISELFGQYGANKNLKPERSHTFEAGLQAGILKNKLDLRVVYFKRKIKDVIDYDATFTYINYDEQDDHGFELESTFFATSKLTIKLFYANVDGRVTTNNGTKDTSYFNLVRRPKHSGGANVSYQVSPRFFVSTHAGYFGKRDDLFYNASTFSNDAVKLDAYLLWDAYAEYGVAEKKLKIFAQINNILDRDYYEVYGFTALGTNFTAGFRFKL